MSNIFIVEGVLAHNAAHEVEVKKTFLDSSKIVGTLMSEIDTKLT